MEIRLVSVDDLEPYARNSRTHSDEQVRQIAASIREFGFTNPVLIDRHGGIVAGHGRLLAARQLGMADVPCIELAHLSEEQRRAYVIADNKIAMNAGWNEDLLAMEIADLTEAGFDLSLTGFTGDEIDELLAEASATKEGNSDQDTAGRPSEKGQEVTRLGDVWILGKHRLVCGDSTDGAVLSAVLQGVAADLCWTDPPYNVAYENAAGDIANDDLSEKDFLAFLERAFKCAFLALKPGGAIYVAHADGSGNAFRAAFLAAGFKLSQCLIWRKDALVLGRSDYQWIHEPILYGWRPGAAHRWFGGRKQVTVSEIGTTGSPFTKLPDGRWQVTLGEETMVVAGEATVEFVETSIMRELRPRKNDIHPTMKPVALVERQLRNSGKAGAVVLDPFGGSGTTLIAAERIGMRARLVELSPNYCDAIVRRFTEYTGLVALRESDGREFAEAGRS